MKAVINEKETAKRAYPWIGILKDEDGYSIVYFTEPNCGACLKSEGHETNPAGEYCEKWVEERFTPFTGSITLSND